MTVQKKRITAKGVATLVGDSIDKAKEKLSGPGPFEKAGNRVDKAGHRIGKVIKGAFKK